jgi:uncharacterized protein YdgA (DUF945 family)
MKKIVIGALLFLVIAGVGAPFVSGLLMENIVKKSFSNLDRIYSETSSGVSVEILKYDRHFASTEIEWKMKLGNLKAVYGIDEIIFLDRADHGFTGIVSRTSLEKNKWFTDFVDHKLKGKNPLSITTEYNLLGQINSTIALQAFSLPVDNEVILIKAGKAVSHCDEELTNVSSLTSWEGFSIPGKMQVDGISMASDLEKISSYLWEGTLTFGVEKSKSEGNAEPFELENFKGNYSLDVDEEEKTLSVVTEFGADHLLAGPKKVGDAFVRIGVVNMDRQGFEEFMKLYTEMANTVFKDVISAEDDPEKMKTILQEQMGQASFQMISAYEHLLKKGLEFQISDLHALLPEGEVKGDAVLSLNKDMTFAQFVPLLQQPELALDIFSLQSEVSLPAALVGDNPMLLSPTYPGMKTGLFVKEGANIVHKAETRDGKLYLNGLEMKL